MKNEDSVKITNVSKKYIVSHRHKPTLAGRLFDGQKEAFWALKNINMKIKRGDRVGIFGPNGSGKTTLLKLIAGVSTPTAGTLSVNGRIVALIDLESGFHPELTGRDNIVINGMMIGMSKKEVIDKFEEIVKFSGIGDFIESPFYTYSSGMKFRLAFAVAAFAECDILIIDEVFVMGDVEFQRKTAQYIRDFQKKREITTIICSHVPLMIWSFADTFYYLEKSKIRRVSKQFVKNYIKSESLKWENIHVDYRTL